MPTKIIGLIRLKDQTAFETYRSQVGATVERYNGAVVARGACDKFYWNELACGDFNAFVELRFPSPEDADRWADSPEYQAIVPIRNEAMDLTLFRIND
jgi:uncharacterized protein (DUF1330 family)